MQVREPVVANQFYPADRDVLKQNVLEYLAGVELSGSACAQLEGRTVKGIIAPHAGYIYSAGVAAAGYHLLKGLPRDKVWKVLLMGPSHTTPFMGGAPFGEGVWKSPLGVVNVKDARDVMSENSDDLLLDVPEAHTSEHSLEVQVPFLQIALEKFDLYPVVLGQVRPDFLAERFLDFAEREDVLVVASSDLSHHLPYEEALRADEETVTGIAKMDFDRVIERGDACGVKGILAMMFMAEKLGWKPVVLDYKNSGDTAGDKNSVVGYASIAFVA
ncbi:AmmeMemoRadiSam system protein B [Candidatus Peregrinibacteria bacterium]|jgi:MEMO1 family protein|nr:AmmeMemoRadiSam system protein B [Candidatus Peregrinibacteria bacterium]